MIDDTLEINMYLIGDRIREARERKHLSQMKLAILAKLSLITVSNMESGKYSPNLKNLIKVSRVLGVSIDYLVSGSDVSRDIMARLPGESGKIGCKVYDNWMNTITPIDETVRLFYDLHIIRIKSRKFVHSYWETER